MADTLTLPPTQIDALAGVNTIVGIGLTVKVTAAVAVHPETLVPVTVQPVVVIGDTELPEWSYKFLSTLDQLIVMSVVPGKSGQKYIEAFVSFDNEDLMEF